tara:strand:- start:86 stop:583 length:498 start_codon:yes stop_codon:yes gene_type:complete
MSDQKKYLEYISLDTEIDNNLKINLENKYFQGIDFSDIIVLTPDNSNEAIDEHGGSYSMEIIYDIRNNQILPSINSINYDENTSKSKIYTNSIYSEIYHTYIEWESFEGCFGVANIGGSWEAQFHGGLEEAHGEISDDQQKILEEEITPQILYLFLTEVLQKIDL